MLTASTLKGTWTALITPFDESSSIDFDAVERLVERQIEKGVSGLVVAGTTGESATLSGSEILELASFVVKCVTKSNAQNKPYILVGNGTNNTAKSIELTLALNELDIDGYLTVTPYYNKPTQQGLLAHYKAIESAANKPIVLYNVPSRTQVDLLPGTTRQLIHTPGFIGIKEAADSVARISEYQAILAEEKADFALLSGNDDTLFSALEAGAVGIVSVTANVAPEKMVAAVEAYLSDLPQESAKIIEALAPLNQALFVETNPIPVKWALALQAVCKPDLRLPLTKLSTEYRDHLHNTLKQLELI